MAVETDWAKRKETFEGRDGEIPYDIQEAKEIGRLMESRQVVVTFDNIEDNLESNFVSPTIRIMPQETAEVPINIDMTDFDNDVYDFIHPSQELMSQTQNNG